MKIAIATPFYDIKAFAPYCTSIVNTTNSLLRDGVDFDYLTMCGNPYVDDARNKLTAAFMNGDAEAIVFLDSDMSWEYNDFKKLLDPDYNILSGCYKTKEYPTRWTFRAVEDSGGRWEECSVVPAGFLKVTREVFDNLYKEHGGGWWSYLRVGNTIHREDVAFCMRAREAGWLPFVDTTILVDHWGSHQWRGKE
jgi:hypothetical protein